MIWFFDVYKDSTTRVSKDTAGGYGTENLLGNGLFTRIAETMIKRGVFWPNLGFMHSFNEVTNLGYQARFEKVVVKPSNACLAEINPETDVVFVCASLVCFETELDFCSQVLNKYPNAKICLLGQISIELIEFINEKISVIGGNYEFIFANKLELVLLLQQLSNQRVVKKSDSINFYPLTAINWSLFGGGFSNKLFTSKKNYPYLASRGCPYSCIEYCSYPVAQGRKVLRVPIEKVLSDLSHIASFDPNGHVIFRDPVFSIQPNTTLELLDAISAANLGLTYTAEIHLKNCSDELISAFNKAGFTHLKFGIESSSDYVRNAASRYSVSNDEQQKIVEKLKEAKITTDGMFILGLPDDNNETVNATISYACDLGLDFAQFSIFTPYPGTKKYAEMTNLMTNNRFEQLSQFKLQFRHKVFNQNQLDSLLYKAYKKFYLSKALGLLRMLR